MCQCNCSKNCCKDGSIQPRVGQVWRFTRLASLGEYCMISAVTGNSVTFMGTIDPPTLHTFSSSWPNDFYEFVGGPR